jgi:hypothetical protein
MTALAICMVLDEARRRCGQFRRRRCKPASQIGSSRVTRAHGRIVPAPAELTVVLTVTAI